MKPPSTLWIRIFGYGGAVVLTAVAVVVLVWRPVGGPGPQAGAVPPGPPAPGGPATAGQPTPAGGKGAIQCDGAEASYARAGDTVKVSVLPPPAALLVSAYVEAQGKGTLTHGASPQGEQGPHVFEFSGVPVSITRHIGVTVITSAGSQTCALK
jgi:hypothetical protein